MILVRIEPVISSSSVNFGVQLRFEVLCNQSDHCKIEINTRLLRREAAHAGERKIKRGKGERKKRGKWRKDFELNSLYPLWGDHSTHWSKFRSACADAGMPLWRFYKIKIFFCLLAVIANRSKFRRYSRFNQFRKNFAVMRHLRISKFQILYFLDKMSRFSFITENYAVSDGY